MSNKKINSIALWLIVFGLTMILWLPSESRASDKLKLGEVCDESVPTQCASGSCEDSDDLTGLSNDDFCTCKTSADCQLQYEPAGNASDWQCKEATTQSKDLHYCQKTGESPRYLSQEEIKLAYQKDSVTGGDNSEMIIEPPKVNVRFAQLPQWQSFKVKAGESITIPWVAQYLIALYRYAFILLSFLAVIIIMAGGIMRLATGGASGSVQRANKMMLGAAGGLAIILCANFMLKIVNPSLTQLSSLVIPTIKTEVIDYSEENDYEQNDLTTPSGTLKRIVVSTDGPDLIMRVDASIADITVQTFQKLKAAGFPVRANGTSGARNSKGCHGAGLAIDINGAQNYCDKCNKGKPVPPSGYFKPGDNPYSLTQEAVNILKSMGWCWGGDWKGFKDYMHFSQPSCAQAPGGYKNECSAAKPYDWSRSVGENQGGSL